MSFTDELKPIAEPIWEATLEHPMVSQLGEGTLEQSPFEQWVRQDYVFLIDYSRVFALGAASAPDLERMGRFATLLESTVNTEMDLHRSYAEEFGITESELEATVKSPTTQAYTDFLVRCAHEGFGATVVSLLPCMWGFNVTAKRLAESGLPDHSGYRQWIELYAGDEFTELTEWCKNLADDVGATATPSEQNRYEELFQTSAQYEYLFWDGAWNEESWPV
ncbi:thiaminase II [Halocatena halophila]|uniref:thiaminase II n=1 Tax=Halocatena halophila TaxID=2814576 RepID=UPI002ED52DB8